MDAMSSVTDALYSQPVQASSPSDDSDQSGQADSSGGAKGGIGVSLLKKSQDLAKQQSQQLIAALPKAAPAPSLPGVGGNIDIHA